MEAKGNSITPSKVKKGVTLKAECAVTQRQFKLFAKECKRLADKLGLTTSLHIRICFGAPPFLHDSVEACCILVDDSKKAAIFLNPLQHTPRTDKDIIYLARHETIELFVIHQFRSFILDMIELGDLNLSMMERLQHDTVHRILNLIGDTYAIEDPPKWQGLTEP
jgi:hypothetical protein